MTRKNPAAAAVLARIPSRGSLEVRALIARVEAAANTGRGLNTAETIEKIRTTALEMIAAGEVDDPQALAAAACHA